MGLKHPITSIDMFAGQVEVELYQRGELGGNGQVNVLRVKGMQMGNSCFSKKEDEEVFHVRFYGEWELYAFIAGMEKVCAEYRENLRKRRISKDKGKFKLLRKVSETLHSAGEAIEFYIER